MSSELPHLTVTANAEHTVSDSFFFMYFVFRKNASSTDGY